MQLDMDGTARKMYGSTGDDEQPVLTAR